LPVTRRKINSTHRQQGNLCSSLSKARGKCSKNKNKPRGGVKVKEEITTRGLQRFFVFLGVGGQRQI